MASVLALVVIMGTYLKKLISFIDLALIRARGRPTSFCWQPAVSEMGHFWKRGASGAEIPRINN